MSWVGFAEGKHSRAPLCRGAGLHNTATKHATYEYTPGTNKSDATACTCYQVRCKSHTTCLPAFSHRIAISRCCSQPLPQLFIVLAITCWRWQAPSTRAIQQRHTSLKRSGRASAVLPCVTHKLTLIFPSMTCCTQYLVHRTCTFTPLGYLVL